MTCARDMSLLRHPEDDRLEAWLQSTWPDWHNDHGGVSWHYKAKDEADWQRYVDLVKRHVLYYMEHGYKENAPFYFPRLNPCRVMA